MRIAYLGPAGTFTEDALREATPAGSFWEGQTTLTVHDAITAVEQGEADQAFVPIENSIEGSVRSTLDALAFDAPSVTIVGEYDFVVQPNLIVRPGTSFEAIDVVLSHPQPLAQCARFLRSELPHAERRPVSSTAEAVRIVSEERRRPWSAIGARSAADLYGCVILREGVSDEANNVTRFVWIAAAGTEPQGEGPWKSTLVFSELGEDHPGALVDALREFSSRTVNLSRIESRPLRLGLGRYMFFIDVEGSESDPAVAEAIEALRGKAESVRILGSYPVRPR
jgi:prephenate dehydratase